MLAGAGAVVGLVFAVVDRASAPRRCCRFDPALADVVRDARTSAVDRVRASRGALVTALLFGLAPALQATRPALVSALKDESGSVVGGTGHARFDKALVVGAGRAVGAAARRRGAFRAQPVTT